MKIILFLDDLSEFGTELAAEVGDDFVHHAVGGVVVEGFFVILEGDGDGV